MRTRWFDLALVLLGLAGGAISVTIHIPAAIADNYPYQGQSFVMDGVISHLDANRDRVIFLADDGKTYTLDTSGCAITLIDGNRAGMTEDLSEGWRIHVNGTLLSAGIAEATQLRVLDDTKPPRERPSKPVGLQSAQSQPGITGDIELRGTVDSVDTQNGAFVVRIKDKVGEHTRTVLMADNTDVSGMSLTDPNAFPVKVGDRVTVAGDLQRDGSVLAGILSLSRTVSLPSVPTPRSPILRGRVCAPSNRYASRDIKIRLLSNNQEIKVKVPRGISIRRNGHEISVHDLKEDDDLRITGTYDGKDFRATRIEVVRTGDG